MRLSIITFNLKGAPSFKPSTLYRFKRIGIALNKLNSDIINLQEVFTYKQLNVLKSELSNYPYCIYEKFLIGPKGGLVTFAKTQIIDRKYISYPYPWSLIINFVKKGWIRVILRNILTGKGVLISTFSSKIRVANTHLIANPTNNWFLSNSFSMIYKICIEKLSEISDKLGDCKLFILTGDFNIPQNSSLYRILIKKLKVKNAFENVCSPTFQEVFLRPKESGKRLDYILVKSFDNNNYSIESKKSLFSRPLIKKKINKGFLSDHIGLQVVINIK